MSKSFFTLLAGYLLTLAILCACSSQKPPLTREQATVDYDLVLTLPEQDISYHEEVKPILGRRCVVCHGCYGEPIPDSGRLPIGFKTATRNRNSSFPACVT